jgi:serine/threonine-protein kinase RsbW
MTRPEPAVDARDGSAVDPERPLDGMRLNLELDIPSDVRYIERIVDLVTRQCAELHYPHRVCSLNVPVALSEALSNAILRGNRDDATKHVRVRAKLDAQRIVLEVEDEGVGFDLDHFESDPTSPELLERENGRGVFLMRRLMDHVERVRVEKPGTVVRLTLQRQ